MSWSVDQVDQLVPPSTVCCCRLDCDALFPLELHRVHLGTDTVSTPHLVDGRNAACVEEDPLGKRSLARIDVSRNTDIADAADLEIGACMAIHLFLQKEW